MLTIGLIPARKGSKGIEKKNIRNLGNYPLIAYTILCAKKSKRLDQAYITTNDEQVMEIAGRMRCPVIHRPDDLAQDESPMMPVVEHAIRWIENNKGKKVQIVSLLQPTSPFRFSEDVDRAIDQLISTGADSVVGVVQVSDHHPMRMYKIKSGFLSPLFQEPAEGYPRQKLPPVYLRNGMIYTCWRDLVIDRNTLLGEKISPFIMPPERSINIDEEMDFLVAEVTLEKHFPHLKEELHDIW